MSRPRTVGGIINLHPDIIKTPITNPEIVASLRSLAQTLASFSSWRFNTIWQNLPRNSSEPVSQPCVYWTQRCPGRTERAQTGELCRLRFGVRPVAKLSSGPEGTFIFRSHYRKSLNMLQLLKVENGSVRSRMKIARRCQIPESHRNVSMRVYITEA